MGKVLIVVDAQEDFTRGALRNEEAIKALPVIRDVVQFAAKHNFDEIIYTQDTHFDNYLNTLEGRNLPINHCILGTNGWNICPEVKTDYENQSTITKGTFGCIRWSSIIESFPTDQIWLCGFCTDICVSANFQILKGDVSRNANHGYFRCLRRCDTRIA